MSKFSTWLLALAVLGLLAGCGREALRPGGGDIAVRWTVVHNPTPDDEPLRAELTLSNRGEVPLGAGGWALYFNFVRMIDPASTPSSVRIVHVNGDFFRLEPAEGFEPLAPGESRAIPFEASAWIINESEAPAGFYFVFTGPDGRPSAPEPVADVSVGPFERSEQTRRTPDDRVPVVTPALRYARNEALRPLPDDSVGRVLPTPVRTEPGAGVVVLDASLPIRYAAGLETEAAALADVLEAVWGARPTLTEGDRADSGGIVLRTGPVTVAGVVREAGDEAYRLRIDADSGVEIVGTDGAGVFYGIQSLRAWWARSEEGVTADAVTIEDAPRFGYRGLHLDVARNFQPKASVLKLLDLMAVYKLNRFHFHLTDDEGWRLEIDGLPELTQVGARRGHTTDEADRLVPSFGSGPDPSASPGSGFYTRADFVEILRHARDRHIEVIPEIDTPGHARAAVRAMEVRYARLVQEGREEEAAAFRLVHPDDRSTYRSVQMWDDNVMDVCLPSTYRFLEHVVDELERLYEEAGAPLRVVHIGGDEVPEGVWEGSPACAALVADSGNGVRGTEDLPGYFLARFNDILRARGLVTAGWEEIALTPAGEGGPAAPNPAFVGRDVRPYVWNSVWGWGGEQHAYELANAGYPVVLANASNLYFDMAYEKDPKEPGYYWAAFVDTRQAFEFTPMDLYRSAWEDRLGNALEPADFAGYPRLTEAGRRHVLGIQGQLWAENLKGPELMEYMAFPKLLGLAERAWAARPAWARIEEAGARRQGLDAAWNAFAHRVGRRELPRLDRLFGGVAYRLPPPGAVVEAGSLKANAAYPGLAIRYTADGAEPTVDSPLYTGPVPVSDGATVRLRTFDARGRGSRTTTVAN